MFEVMLVPIIVAAIGNLILGMVWYHPRVLGSLWARGAGITPEVMERGKKKMPVMAAVAVLAAMVIAYVMNHFGIAWGVFDWVGGVELAFWLWLGFVLPVLLGSVLWEQKPYSYFAINAGYWLASFILIALVLVLLA